MIDGQAIRISLTRTISNPTAALEPFSTWRNAFRLVGQPFCYQDTLTAAMRQRNSLSQTLTIASVE